MPIRDKTKVLGDIREQTVTVKGKTYLTFVAYFGTDREGKKIRRSFRSEKLAREGVLTFFREVKNSGEGIAELKPAEVYAAQKAIRILREHKADVSLDEIARSSSLRRGSFAARLGVRVGCNFGRHTCATMHVAAYADPRKTEAMLGMSSTMRVKHYMGLVSRTEGERYFGIVPTMHGRPIPYCILGKLLVI